LCRGEEREEEVEEVGGVHRQKSLFFLQISSRFLAYRLSGSINMVSEVEYLLSLQAVRERANCVFDCAQRGTLNHFHYDADQLPVAARLVAQTISVSFQVSHRQPALSQIGTKAI
jgi:hypothetical protein